MIVFRIFFFPLRLLLYTCYNLRNLWPAGNAILHHIPDRFTMLRPAGLLSYFVPQVEMHFLEYMGLLHTLARTGLKRILVVIPEMEAPWSQVGEIREALLQLQAKGVEVIAYSDGGNLKTLYLLAAASARYSPDSAEFSAAFPAVEPFFFKGLLDRFGVKVESFTAGKYKSAAEIFTRNAYTPEARRALSHVLHGLSEQISAAFDPGLRRLLRERLLLSAVELEKIGFIQDHCAESELKSLFLGEDPEQPAPHPYENAEPDPETEPQAKTKEPEILSRPEKKPAFKLTSELALIRRWKRSQYRPWRFRRPPSLAVLILEGPITAGRSGTEPHSAGIEAQALKTTLEALADGPEEAILLYINSPGGSATASETLYQGLRELRQKKPLLAYLGPVAASGGYYLACAANRIYASPFSITGSIGVVTIRPNLQKLYARLGLRRERVNFQKTQDLLSESRPLAPASRKLLVDTIKTTYDRFLARVSQSRSLSRQKLLPLAEGRIWTGSQFQEHKMVDGCSGFLQIVDEIKEKLQLPANRPLHLHFYPEVKTNLRTVLGEYMPGVPGLVQAWSLLRKEGPLAYMPFHIE